jgi:hypothetical protein
MKTQMDDIAIEPTWHQPSPTNPPIDSSATLKVLLLERTNASISIGDELIFKLVITCALVCVSTVHLYESLSLLSARRYHAKGTLPPLPRRLLQPILRQRQEQEVKLLRLHQGNLLASENGYPNTQNWVQCPLFGLLK